MNVTPMGHIGLIKERNVEQLTLGTLHGAVQGEEYHAGLALERDRMLLSLVIARTADGVTLPAILVVRMMVPVTPFQAREVVRLAKQGFSRLEVYSSHSDAVTSLVRLFGDASSFVSKSNRLEVISLDS